VRDYFITGQLQWKGRLSSENPEVNEGWCVWYLKNGRIQQEGFFINGQLNGEFRSYYKNGNLHEKANYVNGLKEGESNYYHSNGKVSSISHFVHDTLDGPIRSYHKNGQLMIKSLLVNGKKEGEETEWHANGQLKYKVTHKNGMIHGKKITFNEAGKIKSSENYLMGQRDGEFVEYSDSGNIISRKFYTNDKANGESTTYFDNGNLKSRGFFKDGELDGETVGYYPSGKVKSTGLYENGKMKGEFKSYYPNGVPKRFHIYEGSQTISEVVYYPDGSKRRELRKLNDSTNISKEWFENGMLAQENKHINGTVYSTLAYDTSGTLVSMTMKIPDNLRLHVSKENLTCEYGFKNYKNEWVIQPRFSNYKVQGGFYIVTQNEKYGVLNYEGKIVIPLNYNKIEFSYEPNNYLERNNEEYYHSKAGYFKVSQNNRWGIIDQNNKLILPIQYDRPGDLMNGRFIITSGNLYGFVDTTGYFFAPRFKYLIDLNDKSFLLFANAYPSPGRIPVKYGVINKNGVIIIPCIYDWISPSNKNDLIWVQSGNKFGLFNTHGKKMLDTEYTPNRIYKPEDDRYYFDNKIRNGMMMLYKQGKCGVLTTDGKIIAPFEYDSVRWVEGDYPNITNVPVGCLLKNKHWMAFDRNGSILSKPYEEMTPIVTSKYNYTEDVNQDFAAFFLVRRNGKFGIIDANDSVVIPFEYDFGFAEHAGKIGLIKDGIISFYSGWDLSQPLDVSNFIQGESAVTQFCLIKDSDSKNYTCGVFNNDRKVILPPKYSVSIYDDEYIVYADKNGKTGILNQKGEIILEPQYCESLSHLEGGLVCVVNLNRKVGILDLKQKKFVIDTVYAATGLFDQEHGVCWVKPKLDIFESSEEDEGQYYYYSESDFLYGGWGLMNRNGKYILPPEYLKAVPFRDSIAIVYKDGNGNGLVRSDGTFILPCIYEEIIRQDNGLYLIKKDGWGISDIFGRIIIPPMWTEITDFMGGYAAFWSGDSIGVIDSTGTIFLEARNDGYMNVPYLIENLFHHREWSYDYNEYKYKDIPLLGLIEWSEMISDYFSSNPNKTRETLVRNYLTSIALRNLSIGSLQLANNLRYESDVEMIYPKLDDGFYPSGTPGYECTDYTYRFAGITHNTISYSITLTVSYKGGAHSSYDFYNYTISEKNELLEVTLADLFDTSKNYQVQLNGLLQLAIKNLEDMDIPCSDISQYFEMVENKFAITEEGIDFFLIPDNSFAYEEPITLSIPYSSMKGIINKTGLLKDKVK
jgi:antitoxin component YwqK of YwqJK toxin-antitoxin module